QGADLREVFQMFVLLIHVVFFKSTLRHKVNTRKIKSQEKNSFLLKLFDFQLIIFRLDRWRKSLSHAQLL
ncbi:MAG TPA: hypothetical protein PKN48_15675, partial [Bacteroidales bacterium]|nr:hypothetical protein [Bacteroidales bacterium]